MKRKRRRRRRRRRGRQRRSRRIKTLYNYVLIKSRKYLKMKMKKQTTNNMGFREQIPSLLILRQIPCLCLLL